MGFGLVGLAPWAWPSRLGLMGFGLVCLGLVGLGHNWFGTCGLGTCESDSESLGLCHRWLWFHGLGSRSFDVLDSFILRYIFQVFWPL